MIENALSDVICPPQNDDQNCCKNDLKNKSYV